MWRALALLLIFLPRAEARADETFSTLSLGAAHPGLPFAARDALPVLRGGTTHQMPLFGLTDATSAIQYGAVCDGVTDDSAAFRSIAATATGAVLIPSTCVVTPQTYAFVNPVSLVGYGNGSSVIRLKTGTTTTSDLFYWHNLNGYVVEGITFDGNNVPVTSLPTHLVTFLHSKVANNYVIRDNLFINFPPPNVLNTTTGMVAILDENVSDWEVSNNYIKMTSSSPNTQGGISLVVDDPIANNRGRYLGNTLINASMELKCLDCEVGYDDISGWGFGSAITTDSESTYSLRYHIHHNRMHDSQLAPDINHTYIGGLELWAANSVVEANTVWNNCGDGMSIGGQHAAVFLNVVFDNGMCGFAGQQIGIVGNYGNATYNGSGSTIVGNVAYDSGGGTQKYGYGEPSASIANVTLSGNRFGGNAMAPP